MLKNKKILIPLIIVTILIIVGVAITLTKGLNFGLIYSQNTRLNMYIDANYDINDIKNISNEVLGNTKTFIQQSSTSINIISITANEIFDEQIDTIIQKINEKYEIEMSKESDINIIKNGNVRGRDIVLEYVPYLSIALIVVIAYMSIRYRKIGAWKTVFNTIGALVVVEALYLSILAICRIPIDRTTMPIALSILLATIFVLTNIFENQKEKTKKSQKK